MSGRAWWGAWLCDNFGDFGMLQVDDRAIARRLHSEAVHTRMVAGYAAAQIDAGWRLRQGERQVRCKACLRYRWVHELCELGDGEA